MSNCRVYSNFATNVLHQKKNLFSSWSKIAFNCYHRLLSFDLEWFLSLFLSFVTLTFFKKSGYFFVECPSVWICLMFPHNKIQIMYFGQDLTEMVLCPSSTISGSRWFYFVPILELFSLITWLWWYQPGSPLESSIFPCVINVSHHTFTHKF